MDISEIRRLRLVELRKNYRTIGELARAIDKDAGYVGKALKPYPEKKIGEKVAADIEKKLGLEQGWMSLPPEQGENFATMSLRGNTHQVPEISWVQAGHWTEIIDNFEPGQGEKMHHVALPVGPNAYALRIKGDSMLAPPGGVPTYPEGFIIIVDPSIDPTHNADCVFRKPDSDEATFKRLVIDGDQCYLKPLNPAYPLMEIDESYNYCGTCIHVGMDLV